MRRVKAIFGRKNRSPRPHGAPLHGPRLPNASPSINAEAPVMITGRDVFSALPTEILLMVIEALDINLYSKSNPLHTLSCLNRRLNSFTHVFFWRNFFIGPRAGVVVEPNFSRKHIHERMNAILRDPQRAAFVQQLTVEPTFPDTPLMLKIPSMFMIMPNLRQLKLHISQTSSEALAVAEALSKAMDNTTYPLPFRLDEFECEASLFTSPPGIYKFLVAQPYIRRLSIRQIGDGAPFWTAPLSTTLKTEYGFLNDTHPSFLPAIEEFRGPASYTSLLLHGVQHPLKRLVLYTQSTAVDLVRAQTLHQQSYDSNTPQGAASSSAPGSIESSHPSPPSLTRCSSLSIWTDGPYIWSREYDGYAISPASLSSLRLGCLKPHARVEEHMAQFPFTILREFLALEELEWLVFDAGYLRDEYSKILENDSVKTAAKEFLERLAQETSSDGLSRIAFIAFKRRALELLRLNTESDKLKAIWEQEGKEVVNIHLAGGSKWTMSVKMDSTVEMDFFRLKPIKSRRVSKI
ncbi:hypothetical protein DL93DRAFT_2177507 [Clavulina sp. PMI_390]|nr:hypothetical protein DL93DRAFT_2177507 [Clavulina sp. PMI_390]